MIICGREEPLTNNPFLHELVEELEQLRPAMTTERDLNRYSFVSLNKPDAGYADLTKVVLACADLLSININWCCVWDVNRPSITPAQNRWRLSRLSKAGWDIQQQDDLGIAIRTRSINELEIFEPQGFKHQDGAMFLVLGKKPKLEDLFSQDLQVVMKHLARSFRVIPSSSLMAWIKKRGLFFAYRKKDDIGHQGLVVIGTKQLPIKDLLDTGVITEIHDGSMASSVWTHSRFT
jgi:hypothetical protein